MREQASGMRRHLCKVLLVMLLLVSPPPASGDCTEDAFPTQQCDSCTTGKFSPQPGISTVAAGSTLSSPNGTSISHDNATIYIAAGNSISAVSILTQQTQTLVSGLSTPAGIAFVPGTTKVLIAEFGKLSFMDTSTYKLTTLAGTGTLGQQDGIGTAAKMSRPADIAVSANGSHALITDTFNHNIRVINLLTLSVDTVAGVSQLTGITTNSVCGDRAASSIAECKLLSEALRKTYGGERSGYYYPQGCFLIGNTAYYQAYSSYSCSQYSCICWSQSAYQDGFGTSARFNSPRGITLSFDGKKAYVADSGNHRIRVIDRVTGSVTTLAGNSIGFQDGYELTARFNYPWGIALIPSTRRYSIPAPRVLTSTECGVNLVISAAVCQQLAGFLPGKVWSGTTYHSSSRPPGCFSYGSSIHFNAYSSTVSCSESYPCVCQEDDQGDVLLVTDSHNNRIRSIRTDVALVTTFAGTSSKGFQDGMGASALFDLPTTISHVPGSGMAILSDSGNSKIRVVTSGACTMPIACPDGLSHPEWYDFESIHPQWKDPSQAAGSSLLRAYTRKACECEPGYYGPNGDTCTPCDLGFYKSVSGSSECYPCPPNSISPTSSTSLQECRCNAGFTGEDGSHCEGCGIGKFKETLGSASCAECARGSYSALLAATTCTKCEAGKSTATTASITSAQCSESPTTCAAPAGFYCHPSPAGAMEHIICPSGYNCPGGVKDKQMCPYAVAAGWAYCPSPPPTPAPQLQPTSCSAPAGHFCHPGPSGAMEYVICPSGYNCPGGAKDKQICPQAVAMGWAYCPPPPPTPAPQMQPQTGGRGNGSAGTAPRWSIYLDVVVPALVVATVGLLVLVGVFAVQQHRMAARQAAGHGGCEDVEMRDLNTGRVALLSSVDGVVQTSHGTSPLGDQRMEQEAGSPLSKLTQSQQPQKLPQQTKSEKQNLLQQQEKQSAPGPMPPATAVMGAGSEGGRGQGGSTGAASHVAQHDHVNVVESMNP